MDHLENTKGFNLRSLRYLVMDEADRILNMDFETEVSCIGRVCVGVCAHVGRGEGMCGWGRRDKTETNGSKLDVVILSYNLLPPPSPTLPLPPTPTPFHSPHSLPLFPLPHSPTPPSLPQVDKILKVVPRQRMTYLYSATMTKKVQKLQRASLHDPVKIEVSTKYVGQGSRVKVHWSYTYCLSCSS